MSITAPIATAVIDMVLLDDDQQSVLSIHQGAQSQSLSLELRNMTARDIVLGDEHGTKLAVTFRPGALQQVESVTASGNGWTGALDGAQEFPSLVLTHPATVVIAPGARHAIKLAGLVPSPSGGSRSTRVEVGYSDVHLVGEGPVSGRRILHLGLLQPSVGPGTIAGSYATSGPFEARIVGSSDVVTGGTANQISIVVAATVPTDVTPAAQAGVVADEVSRFAISMPPSSGGSLRITGAPAAIGVGAWSVAGNTIAYSQVGARRLEGDFLRFSLDIITNLEPGIYPLYLEHEDFEDRRGRLVLLLNVTAVGVPGDGGDIVVSRRVGHLSVGSLAIGSTTSNDASTKTALANAPLSVCGAIGAAGNGVEFRHTNGTQGIGFGYNTIYATGSNPDQPLAIMARGARGVSIAPGSGDTRLNVDPGRISLNASDIYCGRQYGNTRLNVNGPLGAGRTVEIVARPGDDTALAVSDSKGKLVFRVDAAGSVAMGSASERTKLAVNGTVYSNSTVDVIGRTGDAFFLIVADPSAKVVHQTTAWGLEVQAGRNAAKPGGGAWAVLSDRRLKKDVAPLKGALERLLELRSVSFEYLDPEAINEDGGQRVGFIADEVEQVFPDWVGERPDGMKYVAVKGFESLAVAALRDLRAEKDEQVAALERTIAALEARLATFEGAAVASGSSPAGHAG